MVDNAWEQSHPLTKGGKVQLMQYNQQSPGSMAFDPKIKHLCTNSPDKTYKSGIGIFFLSSFPAVVLPVSPFHLLASSPKSISCNVAASSENNWAVGSHLTKNLDPCLVHAGFGILRFRCHWHGSRILVRRGANSPISHKRQHSWNWIVSSKQQRKASAVSDTKWSDSEIEMRNETSFRLTFSTAH